MTVFISRELAPTSMFRYLLESAGWTVHGLSLVNLSPIIPLAIPACDWLFFSSKNAVQFFFQQPIGKQTPLGVKWAAIGPVTAKALSLHCTEVNFIGTGDPEETATLFEPLVAGQTVVFPSARHTREGVKRFLSPEVQCISLAIYDNIPILSCALRTDSVLVFTSPMNASAYFSTHHLQPNQSVIAIGKSTLASLQSLGIERLSMAAHTSEEAMANAVLECLSA